MASGKLGFETRRKDEPEIGKNDDWDDSALIAAYDKAMNKAKVEVAKKKNIPYKPLVNDQKSMKKIKWRVGDKCRAAYSEDGLYYEATIISVNESNGTCFVEFIGYGNEEEALLSSLEPSLGRSERQKQEEASKYQEENEDYDDAESSSYSEEDSVRKTREESKKATHPGVHRQKESTPEHRCNLYKNSHQYNPGPVPASAYPPPFHPPPPLPTPPPFLMDRAGPEDDKLYSMLLSWYMSGYHTGYYMGSRQAQSSPSHLRNMYYGH